jgi:long-chain acyl-CoA synthetase
MFRAWSQRDDLAEGLAGVRLMVSGAAPLPPATRAAISAGTGLVLHEGYGLTETAPALTTTLASAEAKDGSVGRPLPGVELRLVDDLGAVVDEDGDPGEVSVRGANLFSGYWPDGAEAPDADGWWGTGDVGYLDGDGDLFLVDRRKELVLVSGFNVYPREVEDVVATHPGVREVAVIAVPDLATGEAVKAIVVPEDGSGLTEGDVVEWCRARLARFKTPTVVELVDALPHSVTGKVAKRRLRENGGENGDEGRDQTGEPAAGRPSA